MEIVVLRVVCSLKFRPDLSFIEAFMYCAMFELCFRKEKYGS